MAEIFHIRFIPEDQIFAASGPVELFLAAATCGIVIDQPCGSRGTCGNCRVRIIAGEVSPSDADRERLSDEELREGWRLACKLVVRGGATIEIPPSIRSLAGKSFGGDVQLSEGRLPVVDVRTIHVPEASHVCQEADLDRAALALGFGRHQLRVSSPAALASLREHLGRSSRATLVLHDAEVVACSAPGERPVLGLAVDIGSTSLAAALVDLRDGRVVASDARLNPQVVYGADIITRIHYSTGHPDGLAHLTRAVRDGLGALVGDLLVAAASDAGDVVVAACAGNPTMMHTWVGVSPAPLGTSPYVGGWSGELTCRARDVSLPICPDAPVYVFPMVRSHVGSDAVAAAIACGLDSADRPTLLVDLGTNTEVMLASGGRFVATSAAAGPAFEGATITHGMRAAPGAIDAVSAAPGGRLAYKTIGNVPARGICGSGLIDAVAELLRAGAISATGHLRAPRGIDEPLPDDVAARFTTFDGQNALILAWEADAHAGRAVVLTAKDVRQLQLVKGSILAATTILCRHVGLEADDLRAVLIAGAFGNYVRKSSALAIGLVPSIDPESIVFVGNAAGVGARLAICDRRVRTRAKALAEMAEYVELANHPAYPELFLGMLAFPAASAADRSGHAASRTTQ